MHGNCRSFTVLFFSAYSHDTKHNVFICIAKTPVKVSILARCNDKFAEHDVMLCYNLSMISTYSKYLFDNIFKAITEGCGNSKKSVNFSILYPFIYAYKLCVSPDSPFLKYVYFLIWSLDKRNRIKSKFVGIKTVIKIRI